MKGRMQLESCTNGTVNGDRMRPLKAALFFLLVYALAALRPAHGQSASETFSDTSRVRDGRKKSELEGPVKYEAQDIDNWIEDKMTILTGRARVDYQNIWIKAGKITVDWENDLMTAEGIPDTVWQKGEGTADSIQTIRMIGLPELSEDGQVTKSDVMFLNFRSKKGRVIRGRTSHEDGFYFGKTIKMVKPQILNISDATYTTCDKEEDPHFHFWFKKMKIEVNKKVVAKPIVMYIGNIPVLALPFAYFPIQKGRHSGVLFPKYGESTYEGRYFKGLGYYWAASDYWDVKGRMDFYEKSGFLFRGDLNYKIRYKMQGTLSGSFTHKDFEISGEKQRLWDLAVNHYQDISPTMNLKVGGQFVSSGRFYKNVSANRDQRLRQEIRSNATLTKRWAGSKTLTVNFNQTRKLNTDEIFETLPQISFRLGQAPLFRPPEEKKKGSSTDRWYHSLYFSYSSQILFKRDKTLDTDSTFMTKKGAGWDHSLNLSSPQKLFGWLTLNPSFSYHETWLQKQKEYSVDPETGTLLDEERNGFFARRIFDASTSVSTKIYGLFRPTFLKSVVLRHIMTPNLRFVYQPDFSSDRYGYYQTLEDTSGKQLAKDRFSGCIFGSTPSGGSKKLDISIQNLFQMKIGEGDSSKKVDLFNWNVNTSYNWKADEFPLEDFSSTLRASPFRNVSLDFRTTHSPYQIDEEGAEINRLYVDDIDWKDWKSIFRSRWLRLSYFGVNLNLRLKGRTRSGGQNKTGVAADTTLESPELSSVDYDNVPGDRLDMDDQVQGFDIPWDLTTTLSYTDSRYNPMNPNKKFWLRASLDFNLTKHWKISYRAQWDLITKEAVSQDFVFYRDLHCWEASISWTPTGYNKRFYFRINVKSPMLRDIKYEKGAGRTGYLGTMY
jgi:lipopolysaccharide assembly outer membrane protein LptD (OstA)